MFKEKWVLSVGFGVSLSQTLVAIGGFKERTSRGFSFGFCFIIFKVLLSGKCRSGLELQTWADRPNLWVWG